MRFLELFEKYDAKQGLKQGPPYPAEQQKLVKAMQMRLTYLGYDVGPFRFDGKYGPDTADAVAAFKNDFDFDGDGSMIDYDELVTMSKAEPVSNPTKINNDNDLGDLADIGNAGRAKAIIEDFLGKEVTIEELGLLIRAVAAEASRNAQERAAVAAVILNRTRSNSFPNNIRSVLTQRNQFQAVTGTRFDPGPSRNFTNLSTQTAGQVIGAIIRYLPNMNKGWLNFTSNNPRAYGRGTNIDFMYAMRSAPGAEVIGQTVFGTV
jgi:peptidoglycan hydrolase-like protein with peptidoglycan-binding domain